MEEGNQEKEPKGDSKSLDHLPESVRNAILRAKKLKGNSLENTLQDTKEASQENKVIHRRFYSPLVRSTAKENGISQTELDGILGSGKDGRVTKKDVLSYLEGGRIAAASLEVEATPSDPESTSNILDIISRLPQKATPASSITPSAGDEIIEKECNTKFLKLRLEDFFEFEPTIEKAYDEFSIMVESGDTVDGFINEFIDTDDAHNMGIILKGFKKISEILGDTLSGNFKEDTNPDDLRKKYAACINLIDILQTKYYSKSDELSESDRSWLEEISRRVVAMPIEDYEVRVGSPEPTGTMYYKEHMSTDKGIPHKERIQIGIERLNNLKRLKNYIEEFGLDAQKYHYKASLIGAEKYLEAITDIEKKGLRILESEIEIFVESLESDKKDIDSMIVRKYSIERIDFYMHNGEKKICVIDVWDEFYLRFIEDGSCTFVLDDLESKLDLKLIKTHTIRTDIIIQKWHSNEIIGSKWTELKNKWSAVSSKDDFKLQFRERTVFYIDWWGRNFLSGITEKGSEILFMCQCYNLYRAKNYYDPVTGYWDEEFDDAENIDDFLLDEDSGFKFTYDKLQEVFELKDINHEDFTSWAEDTYTFTDKYSEEQSLQDWKKLKDSFTELSSRDQVDIIVERIW